MALMGIDDNYIKDFFIGIAAGAVFIAFSSISSISIGIPAPIYPQSAAMSDYVLSIVASVIVVGVLAPCGEEALFRGSFMFLSDKVLPTVLAVLATGIAFSLFHWRVYGVGLEAAFVGALIFSLASSMLSRETQSLLPSIIMHSMVNVFLLVKSEELLTIGGF